MEPTQEQIWEVKRVVYQYLSECLKIPVASDNEVTELAIKLLRLNAPPMKQDPYYNSPM